MQSLFNSIIFTFAASYVLLLNSLAYSSRSLQQALVLLLLTMFVLTYIYFHHAWKELNKWESKLFFLTGGTILIQLLIVATGNLKSPFFILIHLFMISLSLLFNFSVAVLFLLSCLFVIIVDLVSSTNMTQLLVDNPSLLILQFTSLIAIIPLAYIISKQYHFKDALATILRTRIKTTETILENLPEIIIVTDPTLRILSVNDAAARTLQRSRSELLGKPLFDILLLKNKQNKLVTEQTLFPNGILAKPKTNDEVFILIKSPVPERLVTMQIQPITHSEKKNSQISFIISFTHASENSLAEILDQARTKYEALVENIKRELSRKNLNAIKTDLLLLEKIEQDTYDLQMLQNNNSQNNSRVDVAKLCQQIVLLNKDFAEMLHVRTTFSLPNFGEKDIAPLTVSNYPVKPEQLTGPFFTTMCDAQKIELAIKKTF